MDEFRQLLQSVSAQFSRFEASLNEGTLTQEVYVEYTRLLNTTQRLYSAAYGLAFDITPGGNSEQA